MDWKSRKIASLLEAALLEDRATSDTTTQLTIDPHLKASATILAKQDCVVAGLGSIPRFLEAFARLEKKTSTPRFEVISHPEIFDGVRVKKGQSLAIIRHNARTLLSTERVILNLMQRMSGIATLTRQYVDAIKGTKAHVLDTRKTIPGLRLLDKYAVLCGGGVNHRLDLADGILIKNNHISLGGGLEKTLQRAFAKLKAGQRIEVEVRTFEELTKALELGVDHLLLDNMTPAETRKAVKQIRATGREITIESSGNIQLSNIRQYALAGVDFISVGALTHSVPAADLSMRITAELF